MNNEVTKEIVSFRKELAIKKKDRENSDARHQLKSPEGRRQYWKDLVVCGIFRTSMAFDAKGQYDPYVTAFNEGRRSIGLEKLDTLMTAKPDAFYQMQQEHLSEKKMEESQEEELQKKQQSDLV